MIKTRFSINFWINYSFCQTYDILDQLYVNFTEVFTRLPFSRSLCFHCYFLFGSRKRLLAIIYLFYSRTPDGLVLLRYLCSIMLRQVRSVDLLVSQNIKLNCTVCIVRNSIKCICISKYEVTMQSNVQNKIQCPHSTCKM